MITVNRINLGGLDLQPSRDFSATLTGILDFTQTIQESENFYDGTFFGSCKSDAKDLTLKVTTKYLFTPKEIEAEKHLNYILHQPEILLKFALEDEDILYRCTVTCTSRVDTNGEIDCILHLCDPNIYKEEITDKSFEKEYTGGFTFSSNGQSFTSSGFTITETISGNVLNIQNDSYSTLYPVITIKGTGKNFSIQNKTTGETLKLNYDMATEDEIIINCNPESRSIKKGGISLMRYKSGTWISIVKGGNKIKVDYTGDCTITVSYREKYN